MLIFLFQTYLKQLEQEKMSALKLNKNIVAFTFIFFSILAVPSYIVDINFKKILNFNKRLTNYVYAEDKLFLNDNDKQFIREAKKYLEDVQCFQNFTMDVALNYLLRKNNCTKHYIVHALGSKKTQNE